MDSHLGPPIWEICPRGPGQRSEGAHQAGERGRASGAAQDRGEPGAAVCRPGQAAADGFTTGEYLGAGHHVTQGARRRSGLSSGAWHPPDGGWLAPCEPGHAWVRPGVHVQSVGVYPANHLGNVLGGPGRGRGPHGPGHRATPGPCSGVLDPVLEAWLGAGPDLTATHKR